MTENSVSAFAIHQLPGRLRLKIPEKRGDSAYFASLPRRLAQCPGITGVETNARTGSLLVFHSVGMSLSDIAAYAEDASLFSIRSLPPAPRQSIADHAGNGLAALDKGLAELTGGVVDVRSVVFLFLTVLVVRQSLRGQIAGPVTSLLVSTLDFAGLSKSGH